MRRSLRHNLRASVRSSLRAGLVAGSYAGHNMVAFDGTNDYLNRGAIATGLGTARYMTLAFKIKPMKAAGTLQNLLHFGAANARFYLQTDNRFFWSMTSASLGGVQLITAASKGTVLTTGTEYHYHIAVDFQNGSIGGVTTWLNGVEETYDDGVGNPTAAVTGLGGTPGDATWGSLTQTAIAASNAGAFKFEGQLGFFWFTVGNTTASYITDPTKFYSGGDVDLGTDGTGSGLTQPVIFWGGRNTAADWNGTVGTQTAQNKGSGADLWTMASDGVV